MTKKVLGIALGVLMLGVLAAPLSAQLVRDTLYEQDFNGTWSTTSPPTGWTITYTGSVGSSDWHRYTGSVSGHAGPMAQLSWSPSETGLDQFISPVINATANPLATSIYLRVWHLFDDYGGAYTAQIRGSNDGGSNWNQTILDYRAAGITLGPADYEDFDITSWALGQNDIRVNFYANGNSFNIDYWYFDDFMIIAEWFQGGGPGGYDFEMAQIERPMLEEEANLAFKPRCKVLLIGDEPNTASSPLAVETSVFCRIKDVATQQTVYEDIYHAYPFEIGYNQVEFKNFTPQGGKTYEALFVVEYAEDPTPENNDKSRRFQVAVGVQVDATEILAPVGELHLPFAPSCKFKEMLGVPAADVMLWCAVDGTPVDSLAQPFDANQEFTATFGTVSGLADGEHTVKFWATDTKNGSQIGEAQEATFTYTGIVEEPEVRKFDLAVAGRTVTFSLPEASSVNLVVYDVAGNLVATLASGSYSAGSHVVTWNADASAGLYFVKIATPEHSAVRKLTLLK